MNSVSLLFVSKMLEWNHKENILIAQLFRQMHQPSVEQALNSLIASLF